MHGHRSQLLQHRQFFIDDGLFLICAHFLFKVTKWSINRDRDGCEFCNLTFPMWLVVQFKCYCAKFLYKFFKSHKFVKNNNIVEILNGFKFPGNLNNLLFTPVSHFKVVAFLSVFYHLPIFTWHKQMQ